MLAATIQSSIAAIEEKMLFNLVTKMMAYKFSLNGLATCETIFDAVMDVDKATATCYKNNFNFSDTDTVALFVELPWFNNNDKSNI